MEGTTQFEMDLNTGLTQALSDGTNTYLYGNGRIGQFTGVDSAYFLGDALGSVRQMLEGNGTISLIRDYAPYGEVLSETGSVETAFSFTGEWMDGDTDQIYLRKRLYAPGLGRFIQKDPSRQEENWYEYAASNPIINVDPSGLFRESAIAHSMGFKTDQFDEMLIYLDNLPRSMVQGHARKWGFLAALLDAQDFDSMAMGVPAITTSWHLPTQPNFKWRNTGQIFQANCQLYVGGQPLLLFFYNDLLRNTEPKYYWRDTTPVYYELHHETSTRTYVDGLDRLNFGDNSTTRLPDFISIDIGLGKTIMPPIPIGAGGAGSFIIDRVGNIYLSRSIIGSVGVSSPITLGFSEGYASPVTIGSYPILDEKTLREGYIEGDWIAFQFAGGTPGFMGAISTSNGNHTEIYSQQALVYQVHCTLELLITLLRIQHGDGITFLDCKS